MAKKTNEGKAMGPKQITLDIGLCDEEGELLTGAEFVEWMKARMEEFVEEAEASGDADNKLPSAWLELLAEFWSE